MVNERHLAAAAADEYLAGATLPQPEALQSSHQQHQNSNNNNNNNKLVRTVNPGDRVNIPCSLANLGGSIQFAKDDQPIILDSGCAHCQLDISNDGQASLTINRVSLKDQGHWQCWRLDSNGLIKQKIPIIQLVVTNSPELPILIVNDKELLGGNNLDATITIKENEIITFKCLIKGAQTPVDYVQWMLDSSQNVTHLSQLMMEYSAQENNYLTQSILKLNATKSMNLKSISCLTNHQLWLTPMTVTAFMNVLYEPSFTISREPGFGVPVSEGMSVILKCEIDSNPSSAPIWIKDADNNKTNSNSNEQQQQLKESNLAQNSGEPIVLDTQEDGSVVFQPVRKSDSGWYRCKTENKYGNFSSFGYYLNVRPAAAISPSSSSSSSLSAATTAQQQQQRPPLQIAKQQSTSMIEQQSTRVLGPNQPAAQVAQPLPPPQNFLLQPSSSSSSAQKQLLVQQLSNSNNIINNDQPATVGSDYKCPPQLRHKSNGHHSSIDGFPEIENQVTTVHAMLGRQLILPLRFCCQPGPARVFWIHRHLAMIPGRMFGPYITRDIYTTYNSLYCYESTFEIESVKPEDIGTVYVFVSNEKGTAGAQIHIQLAKQLTASSSNSQAANELMLHNNNNNNNQFQSNSGIGSGGTRFHLLSTSSSSSSSINYLNNSTLFLTFIALITSLSTITISQFSPIQFYCKKLRSTINLQIFDNR